jgi:hypothetical protein
VAEMGLETTRTELTTGEDLETTTAGIFLYNCSFILLYHRELMVYFGSFNQINLFCQQST